MQGRRAAQGSPLPEDTRMQVLLRSECRSRSVRIQVVRGRCGIAALPKRERHFHENGTVVPAGEPPPSNGLTRRCDGKLRVTRSHQARNQARSGHRERRRHEHLSVFTRAQKPRLGATVPYAESRLRSARPRRPVARRRAVEGSGITANHPCPRAKEATGLER